MSHKKENVERMMKELVEEVERLDMEPEPTSLWRKSIDAREEKQDMVIEPAGGKHILPFEDAVRILGHSCCRDGRKQISLFLTYLIAEGTWRTMEWSNREKKNVVLQTLEKVFRWRSTFRWKNWQAPNVRLGPVNFTNWKHTSAGDEEWYVTAKKKTHSKRQEGPSRLTRETFSGSQERKRRSKNEHGEESHQRNRSPGERTTARQGKPYDIAARTQLRGHAVEK